MLLLFVGPTASGKTTLLNKICERYHRFIPVVRFTTRGKRETEIGGKDYNFISVQEFEDMIAEEEFVEYEEYSGDRFYGTTLQSLKNKDTEFKCSTITPSGLLQLCLSGEDFGDIYLIYCHCSLGEQVKRYVGRTSDFTIDSKMEMCDRLARDEGMFKGIYPIMHSAQFIYSHGKFEIIDVNTEEYADCVEFVHQAIMDSMENDLFEE